jgi:hypothetical protein
MADSPSTSGSCGCGRVRFELAQPAALAGYCHCTRCQKRTGGASSPQARIDGIAVTILSGEELITSWRHPDGGAEKSFCSVCGSHLFSASPADHSVMSVRMSAFDGDPGVRPSFRQYVDYAAAWEPIPDDGLERHGEDRPRP